MQHLRLLALTLGTLFASTAALAGDDHGGPVTPKPYTAGTWGPAASTALLGREGFHWHQEI